MSISRNSGSDRGVRSAGFTLIEMTAVLTILALVFATAVLSFRGPYSRAMFQSLVERLIDFDDRARRAAMAYDSGGLIHVDFEKQSVSSTRWVQAQPKDLTWALPSGFRIEQVKLGNETFEHGTVSIVVANEGTSATYAVQIAGPNQRRWIVFLGGTGQPIELTDESKLTQIIRTSASRSDAH